MTATMLSADALLAASIMTRSSMRFRLTGSPRDCTINTSEPRMLCSYLAYTSPPEKLWSSTLPRPMSSRYAILSASPG